MFYSTPKTSLNSGNKVKRNEKGPGHQAEHLYQNVTHTFVFSALSANYVLLRIRTRLYLEDVVTSIPIHLPGTVFRRIYVLSPTIMSPQTAYRGGTFRSCLLATCRAYSAPTGRAASIERHHNAARRSMQRKRRVHGHTNPISN